MISGSLFVRLWNVVGAHATAVVLSDGAGSPLALHSPLVGGPWVSAVGAGGHELF